MEIVKYNKEDKILINTLILMAKESNQYYDKDIAAYILNKIGKQKLQDEQLLVDMRIHSNFLGYIYKTFSENLFVEHIDGYQKENNIKLQEWKKLLEPYYDNVNVLPYYIVETKKGNKIVEFPTYYALKKPLKWIKNLNNDKLNWSISEEQELMIITSILTDEYYNNQPQENLNENEVSLLLNLISKHKITIKKQLPKKDNEKHWVTKILKSNIMIDLLSKGNIEEIKILFNDDGLKTLFSKINEKNILDIDNTLFIKLMKIKSPKELLSLMCNEEGYFNICTFFHNKYQKGYKVSLLKEEFNKSDEGGSNIMKKILNQEIEYLQPALKTIPIEDNVLLMFWHKTLCCKDYVLFKKLIDYLPLPEQNSKTSNFFKKFNEVELKNETIVNDEKSIEIFTAREWYDIFNYEKLDSQLVNKTEIKAKKKI